jgi:hypothetical protein
MRHGQILATDDRGLITHVRFDPSTTSTRYRRVTVVDAEGRRAWSNPL